MGFFVHNHMDLFISNSSDWDYSFAILVMMKNSLCVTLILRIRLPIISCGSESGMSHSTFDHSEHGSDLCDGAWTDCRTKYSR